MGVQVRGLERILARLAKQKQDLAKRCETGLKAAGLELLRDSMALVPIDTGTLRASAPQTTRLVPPTGGGFDSKMIVGYGTAYAVYVHEDLDALHGQAYNDAYIIQSQTTVRSGKNKGQTRTRRKWSQRAVAMGYHRGGKPHIRGPHQQAKFLERPFRENLAKYKGIIRAAMGGTT